MDSGEGAGAASGQSGEPVLTITSHYTYPHVLRAGHHYSLIITRKRAIAVCTDTLIAARKQDTLAGRIPAHAGPLGYFLVATGLSDGDVDFGEYFGKMDPSRIIAAHPDAETIMLDDVITFGVWVEPASPIDTGFNFQWVVKITGKYRTIELFSIQKPDEIIDNGQVRELLGPRFELQNTDMLTTLLFGRKNG